MTVGELMEELAKHPPDTKVLGRGYENGYDDVTLGEGTVAPYHGAHYDGAYGLGTADAENAFFAVILA